MRTLFFAMFLSLIPFINTSAQDMAGDELLAFVPSTLDAYAPELPESRAASFPGGTAALGQFIQDNLVYPVSAIDDAIKGIVKITFLIDENGTARGFNVTQSLNSACDSAALNAIIHMPSWEPAVRNFRRVRQKYCIPIRFSLKEK